MMSHIRGTHGQVHLSRRKRVPEMDGSTASYTHNSGSQQRKDENAMNPRNGDTICPTVLIGQNACHAVAYKIQFPLYPYLQWLKIP